jgi:nicotinate-nucleotide adenylyltransferase
MKIGIFGGSFNPPHLGHQIVAEMVREQASLDQVWWMPASTPPHKQIADEVSAVHRLGMVQAAIEGNAAFVASDFEFSREGKSYTVETLRQLQSQFPEHQFSLIIGGDSLRDFHKWHLPDEIVERVPLLVYRRPDADLSQVEARFLSRSTFIQAPLIDISSTQLRQRMHEGKSVRYFLSDSVLMYIRTHLLFGMK